MNTDCSICKHLHCSGCIDDENIQDYCKNAIAEALRMEIRPLTNSLNEKQCNQIDIYINELIKRIK
jgi:hypothetical protein